MAASQLPTKKFRAALLCAGAMCGSAFAGAPTANVVFLDGAIDGDTRPRVIASDLVPGYVRSLGAYDGLSVLAQRFSTDPATGFSPMADLEVEMELPPPPGQYVVTGNQLEPDRAVAWFGEPGVYDPLGVELDPPPGSYEASVRLTFRSRLAGTSISYAIDGGPSILWDGSPIFLSSNAAIQFQGTNGEVGPMKVGIYAVSFPDCYDVDQDELPDRIEVALGLDPLVAERDLNGNRLDDFDEFIRGADAFAPNDPDALPPLFADGDGDSWSDWDEQLRDTSDSDPDDFPASPNLATVEIRRDGQVYNAGSGGSPPPVSPDPGKPYPSDFAIDVVVPGGIASRPAVEGGAAYVVRTSGEQYHYVRARALDGSGRMLLALQPPVGLCIDTMPFCNEAGLPSDWRDEWRAVYEVAIFDDAIDHRVDPRTTAEALLLNRYYELAAGESFVPGEENRGPDQELVLALRAGRNEAAMYEPIATSVTPQMVDLVADYWRFCTSPGDRSMMALLADHFAGRAVDPQLVPEGVRTENIDPVATQTAAFFAALPPARTVLVGEVAVDAFGFTLDDGDNVYRLLKLSDAFIPGTTLTVETIVNVDNCGFTPIPALVTQVIDRTFAEVAAAADTDGDDLDDDWEFLYFGGLQENALGDWDGDGLLNGDEFQQGKSPIVADAPQEEMWMIR